MIFLQEIVKVLHYEITQNRNIRMRKDATYQEKFALLDQWLPAIIEGVKKDIKNDHLRNDGPFLKANFPGKNLNKLTTEDMVSVYRTSLAEGAEALGEFIATRWLLKNSDVYYYFEEQLKRISPNFSELEMLEKESALSIMEGGIKQFGAYKTYVFSVFNAVVFPEEVFKVMAKRAEMAEEERQTTAQEHAEKTSLQDLRQLHAQEIARLTDKYEKKLLGLQKKYLQDMEVLKKQISHLHRKQQTLPSGQSV